MENIIINKHQSFIPNKYNYKYELIDLEEEIICKFQEDLSKIENDENAILCFRGDSINRKTKEQNDFFDKELNKVFMIGSKSRSNFVKKNKDKFEFYDRKNRNKEDIIEDILNLKDIIETVIMHKPVKHNISGSFNQKFIDSIQLKNKKELEHIRLFFISILHNNGKGKKYKELKDYSPFISLTYGSNKYDIAKNFATAREKKGFIFIVNVNTKYKSHFIKTDFLNNELKELGIEWYEDRNKELMVIGGIFPHDILGIMEVEQNSDSVKRLIINPWLYQEYKNNNTLNLEQGIPVDQQHFMEFIKSDGSYEKYNCRDFLGNLYTIETSEPNSKNQINKFQI